MCFIHDKGLIFAQPLGILMYNSLASPLNILIFNPLASLLNILIKAPLIIHVKTKRSKTYCLLLILLYCFFPGIQRRNQATRLERFRFFLNIIVKCPGLFRLIHQYINNCYSSFPTYGRNISNVFIEFIIFYYQYKSQRFKIYSSYLYDTEHIQDWNIMSYKLNVQ